MKWGGVVKSGFFVKKSGKWGCFVKKVDLSSTHGALCTVSVFFILHFTNFFFGGGAYAPNAPPAHGPGEAVLRPRLLLPGATAPSTPLVTPLGHCESEFYFQPRLSHSYKYLTVRHQKLFLSYSFRAVSKDRIGYKRTSDTIRYDTIGYGEMLF